LAEIEKQWIYIAGLFDGEGYLGLQKKETWINVRCSLSNSDEDEIAWLEAVLNKKRIKAKRTWLIQFTNMEDALRFVKNMYPYLIGKKKKANLFIEYVESRLSHKYSAYTQRELEIFNEFQSLPKKGKQA